MWRADESWFRPLCIQRNVVSVATSRPVLQHWAFPSRNGGLSSSGCVPSVKFSAFGVSVVVRSCNSDLVHCIRLQIILQSAQRMPNDRLLHSKSLELDYLGIIFEPK